MDLYDFIGEIISTLRARHGGSGISQEELAAQIGTTANTISRWEKSVYRPSARDLDKLARFFGVSINAFFPNMENDRVQALLRATGGLNEKDLDELIEYARFRQARKTLSQTKRSRRKKDE